MLRIVCVIFFSVFFISGCSGQNNNKPRQQSYSKPLNNTQVNVLSESEKAKTIANSILKIPGVNKAVVVVSGTTALIGLDVNKAINTESYFKRIAMQKANEVDNSVTKIEVTTHDDMYKRISKLNDDISDGKPLSGAIDEFIGLIRTTKISSLF